MTSMYRTARHIGTLLLNVGALSLFLSTFAGTARAAETNRQARSQVRVATRSGASLIIVTFKMPQGEIHVFLPADIRPGDAIIGSARLAPRGRQESDKDANRALLAAYTLTLAGQGHSAQEPALHWSLPADLKADAAVLTLSDPSQREVARQELPLPDTGGASAADTRPGGTAGLPAKGQAGRPLLINQAFPGGTDDVRVLVGDKEAPLLAASPRTLVVESPRDVIGKTKLQVRRGGDVVAEGNFRNNRVSSGNPWPFVIAAVVITGIIVAVSIANQVRHIATGLGGSFGGL